MLFDCNNHPFLQKKKKKKKNDHWVFIKEIIIFHNPVLQYFIRAISQDLCYTFVLQFLQQQGWEKL